MLQIGPSENIDAKFPDLKYPMLINFIFYKPILLISYSGPSLRFLSKTNILTNYHYEFLEKKKKQSCTIITIKASDFLFYNNQQSIDLNMISCFKKDQYQLVFSLEEKRSDFVLLNLYNSQ